MRVCGRQKTAQWWEAVRDGDLERLIWITLSGGYWEANGHRLLQKSPNLRGYNILAKHRENGRPNSKFKQFHATLSPLFFSPSNQIISLSQGKSNSHIKTATVNHNRLNNPLIEASICAFFVTYIAQSKIVRKTQ